MEWVLISFFHHNFDFIWTDDLPINFQQITLKTYHLEILANTKHLQKQYELL